MRILYITPHLSTGGAPQYLLKKIELLHDDNDIYVIEYNDLGHYRVQKDKILNILNDRLITLSDNKDADCLFISISSTTNIFLFIFVSSKV